MASAFAGFLSPSEVLLLWDRVVGFDSLLPLPLLAVAVVTFRWAMPRAGHCQGHVGCFDRLYFTRV